MRRRRFLSKQPDEQQHPTDGRPPGPEAMMTTVLLQSQEPQQEGAAGKAASHSRCPDEAAWTGTSTTEACSDTPAAAQQFDCWGRRAWGSSHPPGRQEAAAAGCSGWGTGSDGWVRVVPGAPTPPCPPGYRTGWMRRSSCFGWPGMSVGKAGRGGDPRRHGSGAT